MRMKKIVVTPDSNQDRINDTLAGAVHVITHLHQSGLTQHNGQPNVVIYAFYPDPDPAPLEKVARSLKWKSYLRGVRP